MLRWTQARAHSLTNHGAGLQGDAPLLGTDKEMAKTIAVLKERNAALERELDGGITPAHAASRAHCAHVMQLPMHEVMSAAVDVQSSQA